MGSRVYIAASLHGFVWELGKRCELQYLGGGGGSSGYIRADDVSWIVAWSLLRITSKLGSEDVERFKM